jgi:hypothetical protein
MFIYTIIFVYIIFTPLLLNTAFFLLGNDTGLVLVSTCIIIIIIIIIIYRLHSVYLHLYSWNKPCLQGRDCYSYSRTSNNGHCRGIQILSVIGGVR